MHESYSYADKFSNGQPIIMSLHGIGENKEADNDALYHLLKMKGYNGFNIIGESLGGAITVKYAGKYNVNTICLTNALGNSAKLTHFDVFNTHASKILGLDKAYKLLINGAKKLPDTFYLKYKHLVLYIKTLDDFFKFSAKTKITVKEDISRIVKKGTLVVIQYSNKDWLSGLNAGINIDFSKMGAGETFLVGTQENPKLLLYKGKGEHSPKGENLTNTMKIYEAAFKINLEEII
jgi:hypothetical protein